MKIVIRQKADDDLDGIFAWIEKDNPRAAVEVIRRIREKIGLLLTEGVAHMGRPGRDEGTRELVEAPYIIDEAADSFAADVQPDEEELRRRGGHWSSSNKDLWAKYFRARARLVESIRTPAKVSELLAEAAEALAGTESGWSSGEISRFRVLIKVLTKLVSDPLSFSAEDARRDYRPTPPGSITAATRCRADQAL
jgi:plasmid stabilization system protein ParE